MASRPPKTRASTNARTVVQPVGAGAPEVSTRPLPRNWCDPRDLLRELLTAFGAGTQPLPEWRLTDEASRRDERGTRRALGGLPDDPAERTRIFTTEIEAAGPLLRQLVPEVCDLRDRRQVPLLQPATYAERHASIVTRWNDAIRKNNWLALPPLCANCGRPVFRKAAWQRGAGEVQISFFDQASCRLAYHRRRSERLRRKAAR